MVRSYGLIIYQTRSLGYLLCKHFGFDQSFSRDGKYHTILEKKYVGYFGVFINTLPRCFIRVHIRLKNGCVPLNLMCTRYALGLKLPCVPTSKPCVHTQYASLSPSLYNDQSYTHRYIHYYNIVHAMFHLSISLRAHKTLPYLSVSFLYFEDLIH